ncbi:MAG: response regulator [Nanoarchaeota archaeon]
MYNEIIYSNHPYIEIKTKHCVLTQKNILVVDDDPSLHKLLQKFVDLHDIILHSTNNGKSGLELILKNKYDIILLDLMMPGYSGMELLSDLEKKRDISKLNIFLFSAADIQQQTIVVLKSMGVKKVINKPIKLRDLLETIGVE